MSVKLSYDSLSFHIRLSTDGPATPDLLQTVCRHFIETVEKASTVAANTPVPADMDDDDD
jgi:hypothetical protein